MPFDAFQTATATLSKIATNGNNDESVVTSFSVSIDPVFAWKRTFSRDGEEFRGASTVITPHANFDVHYKKWKLTYKGEEYSIETLNPVYHIGSNTISHVEVILR